MGVRNPDRFVRDNGAGGGAGGVTIIEDANGDALAINSDGSINIAGTISLGEVEVKNDLNNPLPIHLAQPQSPVLSVPLVGTRSITGVTTLITPSLGTHLRVRRVWIKGAYNIPSGVGVEFEVKLGSTVIARDDVIRSQPYADSVIKLGATDALLTLELFTAQKLFYNIAVEEIA